MDPLGLVIGHQEGKSRRDVDCRERLHLLLRALLLEGLASLSVNMDVLDIDCCSDNFNVKNRKLRSLSHKLSIHANEATSIEVQSSPVASFLIGEEVSTTTPDKS
jgi:hypothetical protein